MLQYRAHFFLKQRQLLSLKAQQAQEQADAERQQRLEREQLINMLGHELKTPLSTLRMLLADRQMPEELATKMRAPLTELSSVVERTIQSDQLEEGKLGVRLQRCSLVQQLHEQLRQEASQPGRLQYQGPGADDGNWVIEADPYLLSVILRNLLDNAARYSPPGSPINVAVEPVHGQPAYRISVGNQAGRAGWPDPDKVFQKYWRAPRASYCSGSGLGLYIVKQLATMLGGSLEYTPTVEQVRFELKLPAPRAETATH
jgi:two-component system, sensor histidine kinase LadS